MSENNTQKPVQKTKKTSKADNITAAIRPIIPKSKKGVYPFYDAISSEVVTKHGREDLCRAIFSSIFFTGTSKVAAEKASRRKFRCNPSQNLDLSKFDHIASMFFETVVDRVTEMPQSSFRLLCIEYIPEMLVALTTAERETINMKTVQLIYGRSMRKKKVKWIKTVATTEEPTKTEITEVCETKTPTTISPHEPELRPELETISELVPEIIPEVASDLVNPIPETPAMSGNIPETQRMDPSTFKNYE